MKIDENKMIRTDFMRQIMGIRWVEVRWEMRVGADTVQVVDVNMHRAPHSDHTAMLEPFPRCRVCMYIVMLRWLKVMLHMGWMIMRHSDDGHMSSMVRVSYSNNGVLSCPSGCPITWLQVESKSGDVDTLSKRNLTWWGWKLTGWALKMEPTRTESCPTALDCNGTPETRTHPAKTLAIVKRARMGRMVNDELARSSRRREEVSVCG